MRLFHQTPVVVGLALIIVADGARGRDPKPAELKARTTSPPAQGKGASREKAKVEPRSKSRTSSGAAGGGAPQVLTKAEAEARRNNPFLLRPGASPGDPPSTYDTEDARDEPPWRQASFFGVRARGLFFVYVLDQSGSMIDDDRLTRATIELRRSVFALQGPQRFEVIFYNDEATAMPGGPIPRPADPRNKSLLTSWLRLIDPDGETNPRGAIQQALALRPDAVFLLSDGEFPDETVDAVTRANRRKIPIHCIDLAGGAAGDQLRRIAAASGGRYVSRPGSLHGGGAAGR